MRRLLSAVLLILMVSFGAGCIADGTVSNPFAETAPPPTNPYYYDDFTDIPIPNEMVKVNTEGFITYASTGSKCGIQRYKARVDAGSLVSTMRNNMMAQGWSLRSFLRAQQSILTYEKGDRFCTLYISDDTIYTNMFVFVSPRLDGDTGAANPAGTTPAPASGNQAQPLSQ